MSEASPEASAGVALVVIVGAAATEAIDAFGREFCDAGFCATGFCGATFDAAGTLECGTVAITSAGDDGAVTAGAAIGLCAGESVIDISLEVDIDAADRSDADCARADEAVATESITAASNRIPGFMLEQAPICILNFASPD